VSPALTSGPSRLFLLDGMALAYRAHFALSRSSSLATTKGIPTGAVFGFLRTLKKILKDEEPDRICVVFDATEPTFRHHAYPEYKATREKMPEELVPQLDWIRQIVVAMGIPFLRVPGFEADDVIGTLAKRESGRGHDVWIVSGDKDMCQLVTEKVRLYNVMRPGADGVDLVDAAGVEKKFGVGPSKVVDVLGLMGDASDNVPGVPGVGEKTAARLVVDHGSLEGALAAAEAGAIPQKKLAETLKANVEQARLSRRLVTIDVDVPLDAGWDDLKARAPDAQALRTLAETLEMEELHAGAKAEGRYCLVDTVEAVDRLARDLAATKGSGGFVFDTETTSVQPTLAELVGLSFAWEEGQAFYVPVNRDPPIFGGPATKARAEGGLFDLADAGSGATSGDLDAVLARLKPVLEDPTVPKTGQNAKYDVLVLEGHGVKVRGIAFDTMVADFLLRPDARTHNLDAMSLDRLGIRKIPTTDLIGTGKSQISMRDVAIPRVSDYACEDADCTLRLRRLLEPELQAAGLEKVFSELEMPLLPVLARMERTGIRLDVEALRRMGASLDARAKALEEKIRAEAGGEINLRSNAQIGEILFDRLRLHETSGRKRPRRTEKGTGWATDERTLQEYAGAHPLPTLILDWRALTKLKSTYVDALPEWVNPATGRVHTTFHQTGAATGRLSSSDPNLQNIPVRGDDGRAIRTAFVPEEGWRLLSADYSQVELRLLAHLADDAGLRSAFEAGEDVHRSTASKVFRVAPEAVTPEMRGRAKAVNFGIVYGMGPQALAQQTGATLEEAQQFIDRYFEVYSAVQGWKRKTVEEARRSGFVTTILGRRRLLPELTSGDPRLQSQAERVAINTPIQGTAADLIKVAMIRVDRRLATEGFRSRMLLQVHDELVFEVPPGEEERLTEIVRREMSGAIALSVPIVVDVGLGANWAEAH
jgi:DNA polymerase-1